MATSFPDTSKAEECFGKLHQMKDNYIFKDLDELINEGTTFAKGRLTRVILFYLSVYKTTHLLISPWFCYLYAQRSKHYELGDVIVHSH